MPTGIMFEKEKGQHILKNPLIINAMIEKVSCCHINFIGKGIIATCAPLINVYVHGDLLPSPMYRLPCVQQTLF